MSEAIDHDDPAFAAEALEAMRAEFLGDLLDELNALAHDSNASRASGDSGDILPRVRALAVKVKGEANSHGLPLLAVAADRLDDYIAGLKEASGEIFEDLDVYLSVLSDLVEHEGKVEESPAEIIGRLPLKRGGFDPKEVRGVEIRVLMAMANGVAQRMIEREIKECGYSITSVATGLDALERIIHEQPDLAIVSAVLPDLPGVDLAMGVKAMPMTRNTAIAVITSYERGHETLANLPPTIPVIRKGGNFADDLTSALKDQFLL